ncbi:putative phosphoribosyl transferase [Planctomycetes bacterium CA13]|uniref:Putative phosphoribosyl transferase n=1 Tax=Novipirellula herctigrandis TaxID=2527986 RepID=A0A5C5Z444_9BACT|nr:putative phosphoribosyl transferase [Planctomycetes bacterium CA13]
MPSHNALGMFHAGTQVAFDLDPASRCEAKVPGVFVFITSEGSASMNIHAKTPMAVSVVQVGSQRLPGALTVPDSAIGVVVFAHGSGSSRFSPRNQLVARHLQANGMATLLFDLLQEDESENPQNVFDIDLLSTRLTDAIRWLASQNETAGLSTGLFGASTGAAAALMTAAQPDSGVAAVVSRGGRPDLAGNLTHVKAPTLLIVGGEDRTVIELNEQALCRLPGKAKLEIVPGATHLFSEPDALEQVAQLASDWFRVHLQSE